MKKITKFIIVINLLLLAGYFIFAVNQKENIIKQGELILLRLAPVDPRSLMQGDYMILDYEISQNVPQNAPQKGYVIVKTDSTGDYKAIKFQNYIPEIIADGYPIEYTRIDNWRNSIKIGAESYFFEEGEASKFEKAIYGGLRVDKHGNSILVGLYDENRNLIQ